jgi:hypothetical protein
MKQQVLLRYNLEHYEQAGPYRLLNKKNTVLHQR